MKSAAAAARVGLFYVKQYQLLDLLISLLIYENMEAELRKTF